MMRRRLATLAAAAAIFAAALVAATTSPAAAAPCTIPSSPGATIYTVNAGATDQACFKVFKDYVDPASFWENSYLDETVDHGSDSGCVELHVRIVGWTSWRHVLTDCGSFYWGYVATYSFWQPIPDGVYAKIDAKVVFKTGSTTTATRTYYDVANIDF